MNKKTIDLNKAEVGDVIEYVDYSNDGIVQLTKVESKKKNSYGEITLIGEINNDPIYLDVIIRIYKAER